MKIVCLQMEIALGKPSENYRRASEMITQAMAERPDVILLPENWNTGFIPRRELISVCDAEGERTKREIGSLARRYGVNIVAGSVSESRDGKLYNAAYIFNRSGECVAFYDKTHLFTPTREDRIYTPGDRLCRFTLDGISCGIIICYDIRFPELARTLAIDGIDVLFVPTQWPQQRMQHLHSLATVRAIENQMFVACCNTCGVARDLIYVGGSMIADPWGVCLALAGNNEQLLIADIDLSVLHNIRTSINVFRDRRPELYQL